MKERNYGRWMEDKMAEQKGIVRDHVRMRNIKRATVMEFGKLITPSPGQSEYLQEEEIWGEDPSTTRRRATAWLRPGWSHSSTRRKLRKRRMRAGPIRQRSRGWT
jgi:hypothetical protein